MGLSKKIRDTKQGLTQAPYPVTERIERKLSTWKCTYLSLGPKKEKTIITITIIKAAPAILIYYLLARHFAMSSQKKERKFKEMKERFPKIMKFN